MAKRVGSNRPSHQVALHANRSYSAYVCCNGKAENQSRVSTTLTVLVMKKFFFLIAAMTLLALFATAQTKKNGTPDMRYSANKQVYGNTYSSPVPASSPSNSFSQPSSGPDTYPNSSPSRPVYNGSEHSGSHSGTYHGGQGGSSHKNGIYSNPNTNNHYGIHKK